MLVSTTDIASKLFERVITLPSAVVFVTTITGLIIEGIIAV